MKQSSSSVGQEDVPLKQRVKTRTQSVKKTKKESRKNTVPVQPNAKKFVIPRNKKTRELLDIQGLESRDAVELLRKIKQSFYQPDNISNYVFENVTIVHNAAFNTEFSVKKQEMRQDGYAQKDLEDTYAYLYLDNWHKVRKMAKEGLCIGSSYFCVLGDPKMGVYISRFPDVALPYIIPPRSSKYLMVFKIAKGKLKAVGERTGDGCPLEPTPNYDGHISKSFPPAHNLSLDQVFKSSLYYFYEFADDGDDLHEKRPRQCCPYAAIQFSVTSSHPHNVSSRSVLSQDTSSRNIPSNLSSQLVLSRNEKNINDLVSLMGVKTVVDGRMYANYSKSGRTLWSGVIKNKENILSSGDLICYSSDILPITIGGHIDIKGKVSFEKLKPLFPSPTFKQLPAISTKCKVFDQGAMYLYCEIRPRDKNNAKLTKLIRFFQKRDLAGVAEFPDSNAHIYVVPTSEFSHQLGLTDRHYPNMLHAIILKRLPKEDIQSYKKMNKMTADPPVEAAVRQDIRNELSRIEIAKKKKREPSRLEGSSRTSSDMDVSSSDDRAESDAEKKVGTDNAAPKENSTTLPKIRPNESESSSMYTNDPTNTTQNDDQLPERTQVETNVSSGVGENVYQASTSKVSDEVLTDVEDSPDEKIQQKVVDVGEVFKSPPSIQNQVRIVDDASGNDVAQTNTITRHFVDPRLGWKSGRFLPASPTEIEPLSSDSGADTPEASPVLRYSKTNELATVVTPRGSVISPLCGTERIESAGIQMKKASGENVSRLSSRLMALFSQTGKRPVKSSLSVETTISTVTSAASTATVTKSTVTELPSLSSESEPVTAVSDKPQTVTLPSSTSSCTPIASMSFPSASDSGVSSECVSTVAENDKMSLTSASSTTLQTSTVALESSCVYPYTNTAHNKPSSTEQSSYVCPMSSLPTTVTISTSMTSPADAAVNSNSALDNRIPVPMVVPHASAEASSTVVPISATPPPTVTVTERITPTSVQTGADHPYLSETLAYPATNALTRTATNICREPEILPTCEQSSQFTPNTYLNEIISFFQAKTTASATTAPGSFLVSPSTSSPTSAIIDEGCANDISQARSAYAYKPQGAINPSELQEPQEPTENTDSMDWYDTVDTDSDVAVTGTSNETYSSDNAPIQPTVTVISHETHGSTAVPAQTPVLGTSYHSRCNMSTTRDVDSPPLPTEPEPPPPPPPLTSSILADYSSTCTSNRNQGSLSYLTTTSAERGVYSYTSSCPDGQCTSVAQPLLPESTDLYEYGLTLPSYQAASDLYFDEGDVRSADSSRSSTPGSTLKEKHLQPSLVHQYPLASVPPPPPPPPLPPLPPLASVQYNTPLYHPGNYSGTYASSNTYPYSELQPIPNPALSEYYCTASGNTGYSTVLPSFTNDFDSTSRFGYTKQITPLWKNSTVVGDDEQPLATANLNQHKLSEYVHELPSTVVDVRSMSRQDKSSSWKHSSEVAETSRYPKTASSPLEIPEEMSRTPDTCDMDVTTENTPPNFIPATEDEHVVEETEVITATPREQGVFSGSKEVEERKSDEEYLARDSGTATCIECEDNALQICAVSHVDGAGQDIVRNWTTKEQEKQKLSVSDGNEPNMQQERVKENILSSNYNVNKLHDVLSGAMAADKEAVDPLQDNRADDSTKGETLDKISSSLDIRVSNVSEFFGSNELPLSDGEIAPSRTIAKSEQTKANEVKNQNTAVRSSTGSSEDQVEHYMFECVDSDDETFAKIPLVCTSGFNQGTRDEYPDIDVSAGKKTERITDLRQLLKEKKRKLAAQDSETPTAPRSRRRVVEIVGREAAVSDDYSIKRSDEVVRDITPPISERELDISDNVKVILENRRKMTSPVSGSGSSTPETIDGARWKITSLEKKHRSCSPESESRERSPDYDQGEQYKSYNRRATGSNDNSRAGSIAGSRPGSSASSRHESHASSRPGSSASLRTGSSASLRDESSTKRYSPRKRSRLEKEAQDETRESERKQARYRSDRVLDVDYSSRLSDLNEEYSKHLSSRGLNEHYRRNLSDRDIDESYCGISAVDSRRERRRSISPSQKPRYRGYVSERDNVACAQRLSPSRESRYRSRYSIKRHDARSRSSDSDSYRARRDDRNNNNWSRNDKRLDVEQTTRNQIDFSDKSLLSRLTRPDVIEHMQNFVYDDLKRTLDEFPDCLDAPDEKDEREKPKPFFGGIGEYIYAKKDEEDDSLYKEAQGYGSGSEISRRTGISGDYHGEGGSAVTGKKGSMSSQSLGFKAKENVTQKDEINNNQFVNMKQAKPLYKCTECVGVEAPGSTQYNQGTSDVFSQEFIAEFKQKRRRALFDQLRNLRGKEKVGSCAIMLAKLDRLKRDVRSLSAAKRRISRNDKTADGKERKDINNRKNNVQNTQDQHDRMGNSDDNANVKHACTDAMDDQKGSSVKAVPYPAPHKPDDGANDSSSMRNAVGDGTDCNMSLYSNNSHPLGLNDRLQRHDETQWSSNDQTQIHRNISSAFNEVEQTELLKSNTTDVERNLTGNVDKNKEKKPDDRSRFVPGQISADSRTLVSASGTGGQTSKDQDESNLVGSRDGDHQESAGATECADIKSIPRNIQSVNMPEQFNKSCRSEHKDQLAGSNSSVDLDWIAHTSKCEFKFQLMIKSQELFPKSTLTVCTEGNNACVNKGRKGGTKSSRIQNNHADVPTSRHDLPVKPSQDQDNRSLEDKDFEKRLSSVLSSLTKSQLDILQNGSPRIKLSGRSECDQKPVDSANI